MDPTELPPSTQRLRQAVLDTVPAGKLQTALLGNIDRNRYHDFEGVSDTPKRALYIHLAQVAEEYPVASTLLDRLVQGDFDADSAEAEAWAQSDAGRAALAQLGKRFT